MAEQDGSANAQDPATNGGDGQPQIGLVSQYVRDFSAENPNAPDVYNWDGQPQIDIQVNIAVNRIAEDAHEVALSLTAKAEYGEKVAFHIELVYCGLFAVRNVPEEQLHPFLFAEAPRIIFPFARRILADAVRDAGFPPLMLEPIDFHALYAQQRAEAVSAAGEEAPPAE